METKKCVSQKLKPQNTSTDEHRTMECSAESWDEMEWRAKIPTSMHIIKLHSVREIFGKVEWILSQNEQIYLRLAVNVIGEQRNPRHSATQLTESHTHKQRRTATRGERKKIISIVLKNAYKRILIDSKKKAGVQQRS